MNCVSMSVCGKFKGMMLQMMPTYCVIWCQGWY